MRAFDRDLIREGHYGQRSCEPHTKAVHMAAPTRLRRAKSSCQQGAVPHMALFTHGAVDPCRFSSKPDHHPDGAFGESPGGISPPGAP